MVSAAVPAFPLSSGPGRAREGVRHEVRRRRLRVLERRALTDRLVRVTLGGEELAGFTSLGPADHVKGFFPTEDGVAGRDCTPAEFRPVGGTGGPELDLDLVVHEGAGPAGTWAAEAVPGDEVEIGGPRASRLAPSGFARALLVADASATPALRRWIRAFAGVLPVRAVLFGDDARLADYLDEAERAVAQPRLALDGREDLLSVLLEQTVDPDTFVFAAGEATTLVPVRRWLKHDLALPPENRVVSGYWRRGDGAFDHHAPLDPGDPD